MKITNDFGNKLKGSIGEQVTASEWNGRNYLKAYARPSNPSSDQQEEKRGFMADGMGIWQGLSSLRKDAYYYHERFWKEALSPLNSFLRQYLNKREASEAYNQPEQGFLVCQRSDTHAALVGARIDIYRVGGSVLYRHGWTAAYGKLYLGMCMEDENYDVVGSMEGYVTKKYSNRTANAVIQLLVELDPI